jgi:hypothetical protein
LGFESLPGSFLMGDPSAPTARERVLAVVPGLDELITRGADGDQVQSEPLAVADSPDAWVVWFVRRARGIVIAVPIAGLRGDAMPAALERCNFYNGSLQWSVLSVGEWERDQVATLSARLAFPTREEDLWEAIAQSLQHLLEAAAPAREGIRDLMLEDDAS